MCVCVKFSDHSRGQPEGFLFISYYTEGAAPFPGLLHFTLDTYLVMLSVNKEISSAIF